MPRKPTQPRTKPPKFEPPQGAAVFGRAYFDSVRNVFSVLGADRKVCLKATRLYGTDVRPVIAGAGQARTRRERKKYVHAFLEGHFVPLPDGPAPAGGRPVFYNPYLNDTFVCGDGKPLVGAAWVYLHATEVGAVVVAGGRYRPPAATLTGASTHE